MPLYEYKCEDCAYTKDLFFHMHDNRPQSIKCSICGGEAIRIFSIGAAYLKKKRVGDVWDEAGVDPGKTDPVKTKAANAERLRRMREQNKINVDRNKNS